MYRPCRSGHFDVVHPLHCSAPLSSMLTMKTRGAEGPQMTSSTVAWWSHPAVTCRMEVVANFFPPTVVTSLMLFWPMGTPTAGMLCAAATCAGAPGALRRSSGACGHEAKDSNFSNACLTNASASSLHVAGCWLWHGQSCRRYPLRSHCSQGVCLITYLFRSFFPVTAVPCDQSLLYGA